MPELAPTINAKSGDTLAAKDPLKTPNTYTNITFMCPTSDSSKNAMTIWRTTFIKRCAAPACTREYVKYRQSSSRRIGEKANV